MAEELLTLGDGEFFLGKPKSYWIALDTHARSLKYELLIEEIAKLKTINTLLECELNNYR